MRLSPFLVVVLSVPTTACGQEPPSTDTAALRGALEARQRAVLLLEVPTVIRLVPANAQPEPDSLRAALEEAAARLGFAFTTRMLGALETITDPAYMSVHYLPEDQPPGYLIIMPGQRPRTVLGSPGPARLEAQIRDYLRLMRRLG